MRAVFWLAQRYHESQACTAEEMASEYGIPANYLVQILLELKSARIVKSQRGKTGGYLLAKAPGEITFGDVLRCIHGDVFDSPALHDSRNPAQLRQAWHDLQQTLDKAADKLNFQQLVEQESKGKMYYI